MSESNKIKVVQSNLLIEASYRLSVDEKRLLILGIGLIDSRIEFPESVTVTAKQYANFFNLKIDAVYKQLRAAKDSLYDRDIKFENEGVSERIRWVYRVSYHERQGKITLYFTPDIKPYLGHIRNKYSPYYLESIHKLKSFYSIRLFEFISRYKDYGEFWLTIERFREIFQLEEKYPEYKDLRRYIILRAVNELNLHTELDIHFNKNRGDNKLWFYFKNK